MIHRNRTQASSLFLLEFILAILFFSITSAACLQLFAKSHLFSRDAQQLHFAIGECCNAAELFRSCGSLSEARDLLSREYPLSSVSPELDTVTLYFDEDTAPCAASEAANALFINLSQEGRMLTAQIQMLEISGSQADSSSQEPVYKLNVKHYIPRRADYAE